MGVCGGFWFVYEEFGFRFEGGERVVVGFEFKDDMIGVVF